MKKGTLQATLTASEDHMLPWSCLLICHLVFGEDKSGRKQLLLLPAWVTSQEDLVDCCVMQDAGLDRSPGLIQQVSSYVLAN